MPKVSSQKPPTDLSPPMSLAERDKGRILVPGTAADAPEQADNGFPIRFRWAVQVAGGAVALIGVEGFICWMCGWPSAFAARTDSLSMAPGALLCFSILGLALMALPVISPRRLWIIRIAAWAVLALVAMRLVQSLGGAMPLKPDGASNGLWVALNLDPIHHMGFFAMATSHFAAAALLVYTYSDRGWFMGLTGLCLSAGVTLVGLVFCLGYLYDSPLVSGRRVLSISRTASAGFFVYGTGMLLMALGHELASRQRAHDKLVRSEQILRRQSSILQSILYSMGDAVVVADEHQNCLVFNPAAQRMFGEEAPKTSLSQWPGQCGLYLPDQATTMAPERFPLLRAIAGQTVDHEEMLVRPPGGAERLITVSGGPLRSPKGQIKGGVIVCRDISARRRAEEERDRFFSLSRDMFCIAGLDGYFKSLNPAWTRTLGFQLEELRSRPYIEFVHPDDREATRAEAAKLAEGGEVIYFENRYVSADGTYRWILWSARLVANQKLIYAAARDITEHKRSQEQIHDLHAALVKRAAQLEALNKELEAFSYSVSHDLRAPVRHIDGFVELLSKELATSMTPKARGFIDVIAGSAREMGRLIDDLLVFSRMGRVEMQEKVIDLNVVLDDAIGKLARDTEGRSISWKKQVLPKVQADYAMMRQVFVNLLSNAIKYTRKREQAGIEIGCRENGTSEYVMFVRDNGVGFDMQQAPKLFTVFQRLHRADEFEGTGIGLANVRRIIARHGGRTWAEGKVNEGATFFFSLPKSQSNS